MRSLLGMALVSAVAIFPSTMWGQDAGTVPPPPTATGAGSTYTLQRNVSLVTLDGVALDAQGKVVTDLKQSDFHVKEDDVEQKVRFFATPGENSPPLDVTVNSTADLQRLAPHAPVNIFVLDEYSTHFEDMAFARYSLKKWLEKQPAKLDSPTMLVAVNISKFEVVRDYTQNKEELLHALDKHFAAYPWTSQNRSWASEEVDQTYNTLRRVAEATQAHAGHKNVLWLGRGFPPVHFSHAVDAHTANHTLSQMTVNELRDARVTLYTIDPAGVMVDPNSYGGEPWEVTVDGGVPGFERLARATGGLAIHGRNDVDAQIGTEVQDGANLYSLTYTPSAPVTDSDKFRAIKVTVDRPGVIFYTHHGYYPADKPAKPRVDGSAGTRFSSEMLNAANSNMQYDGVAFSARALPGNPGVIGIHVQSRGLAYYITHDDRPRYTRVIVTSKTTDAKGKQLWMDTRIFQFVAPTGVNDRDHLDLPVNLGVQLPDNPKAVHARFVVRVEASGRMGTADMDLGPAAVAQSPSYTPGPEAASLLPVDPGSKSSSATAQP